MSILSSCTSPLATCSSSVSIVALVSEGLGVGSGVETAIDCKELVSDSAGVYTGVGRGVSTGVVGGSGV